MHFTTPLALAVAGAVTTVAAFPQTLVPNVAARQECHISGVCLGADGQEDFGRTAECCTASQANLIVGVCFISGPAARLPGRFRAGSR